MVYLKLTFAAVIHAWISCRQSVNSKTIKSIIMLSQGGFWLKVVQSEASEYSTLPGHVSQRRHDSQVVINHLHNQISYSKHCSTYNFIRVNV